MANVKFAPVFLFGAIAVTLFFFSSFSYAVKKHVHKADHKTEKELLTVVDDFSNAIRSKDEAFFSGLFHNEFTPWIGKYTGKPKLHIVHGVRIEGWRGFIDWVASSPKELEKRITNVEADSDGTIASMYFDYEFYISAKLSHWGKEHWQLVKVDGKWKITALLYSIDLPDQKLDSSEQVKLDI